MTITSVRVATVHDLLRPAGVRFSQILILLGLLCSMTAQPALAQSGGSMAGLSRAGQDLPGGLEALALDSAAQRARLLEARNVELLGEGPVDPDSYILGPGDLLGIELQGAFSLSAEDLVSADGTLTFPQLGTFEVSGLTLTEARRRILGESERMVRGGSVNLVLRSTRAFKAFVVGAVTKPGAVRATAVMRVSEALTAADGPAAGGAIRGIQLLHRDGTAETADLLPFLMTGDLRGNPTLRDGTVVVIPPRGATVAVQGATRQPGDYEFKPGEDLASLLRLVGLAPEADSSHVVLQRYPQDQGWDSLRVELGPLMAGAIQVPLRARDRVLIPTRGTWSTEAPVTVQGAVVRPGPIPVRRESVRVGDLVARAGGPLEDAVLERVVLTRQLVADSIRVADPSAGRNFVSGLTQFRSREVVVDLTIDAGPFVEPGDVISVARSGGFVQILGQIRRPGFYAHFPDWDPSDYIDAAGGYARQAVKSQTRVTRGNHGDVLFASDVQSLAPGDILWIPEKPPTNFWQVARDIAGLTTSAITVYLLAREATR